MCYLNQTKKTLMYGWMMAFLMLGSSGESLGSGKGKSMNLGEETSFGEVKNPTIVQESIGGNVNDTIEENEGDPKPKDSINKEEEKEEVKRPKNSDEFKENSDILLKNTEKRQVLQKEIDDLESQILDMGGKKDQNGTWNFGDDLEGKTPRKAQFLVEQMIKTEKRKNDIGCMQRVNKNNRFMDKKSGTKTVIIQRKK